MTRGCKTLIPSIPFILYELKKLVCPPVLPIPKHRGEQVSTTIRKKVAKQQQQVAKQQQQQIPEQQQQIWKEIDHQLFGFSEVNGFKAGNLSNHLHVWERITDDPYIINIIKNGLSLSFDSPPPHKPPFSVGMNSSMKVIIANEIASLLKKGVIERVDIQDDAFYSHLFTRKKKVTGSFRTILNLKSLKVTGGGPRSENPIFQF